MLHPSHPLFGASLKVDRAKDQILSLGKEIKEYLDSNLRLDRAFDPNYLKGARPPNAPEGFSLGDGVALAVARFRSPLPAAWSPVFGEIIHNLRSALDYYVWELYVLENKMEPHTKQHYFPLCLEEKDFQTSGRRMIEGLSTAAQDAIRSVQPFATGQGKGSPLWTIGQLSNHDKHRRVHLAAAAAIDQACSAVIGDGGGDPILFTPGTPLKDGDAIFGRFIPHGTDPIGVRAGRVPLNGSVVFSIVFQQPTTLEWLDPVRALGTMHNQVLDFGQRIQRDFFERSP